MDVCEPSTNGSTSTSAQLVIKEDGNDSASTSPYSVSDASVDEIDTLKGNKANICTRIKDAPMLVTETKQENDLVKKEEPSTSKVNVKTKMKKGE